MKNPLNLLLLLATLTGMVLLVIALTQEASVFYNYKIVIGIAVLAFSGFLRRRLAMNSKKPKV